MPARYWTCPKCRYRNERRYLKCQSANGFPPNPCNGRRPPRKVPRHAVTLRDHGYDHYRQVNEAIHGTGDSCGVCGTPPKDTRNLQREHDHVTGQPRGLACWRCNRLMPKQFGLVEARAIVAYLERVEAHYSQVGE